MKKSELKQLIREAIIAEMRNSSIGVVKNIIKNEFGIDTEIDKTGKFILFPKGQDVSAEVMKVVSIFAPNTKTSIKVDQMELPDGKVVPINRRVIEFL
jgi:hypothetical protein